jgi:hypothetical protein
VLWFSAGDIAWFLATCALVAGGVWITAPWGVVAAMAIATGVAALGVAQIMAWGRRATGLSAADHGGRIGRSWLAMPGWVKLWLTALNLVFLAAPLVLPWPQAGIILLGWAATGPLLAAFAVAQGGLTRHMGIAHLVVWVPLLIWLATGPVATGPVGQGYVAVFIAMVTLCLLLDLYDLARWVGGDRAIIGAAAISPTDAAASRPV